MCLAWLAHVLLFADGGSALRHAGPGGILVGADRPSLKAAGPARLPAFTFLELVTGSIWGKPMWDTWWVWDARLTLRLRPVSALLRDHCADSRAG